MRTTAEEALLFLILSTNFPKHHAKILQQLPLPITKALLRDREVDRDKAVVAAEAVDPVQVLVVLAVVVIVY
jgi:hypothetical protein